MFFGCLVFLASWTAGVARAAEVVWLQPPSEADAARVAALAGARRGPLSPAVFRSLASDVTPDDDAALDEVERALAAVRVHETVLDGERLILAGLESPLDQVRLLRSEQDRDIVYRALLYQGFAADRYWGAGLADAPDAVPYRARIDDRTFARPWLDAFALDPLRKPTDSDIQEAPQREAYEDLRRDLVRALRATVVAPELPPGALLSVDGTQVLTSDLALLEVLPGRHWIHVSLDGRIVARHTIRLDPGQRWEVSLPISEDDWRGAIRAVRAGTPVPTSLIPFIEELGGEVWFAEGSGPTLRAWKVRAESVAPALLTPVEPVAAGPGPVGDVSLAAWAAFSWLYSPDFVNQDPERGARAHAAAPGLGLELAWDRSWLRYGVYAEVHVPVGARQVAVSGASRFRARWSPGVLLGHPRAQATFGLLFPYHPLVGAQVTIPVPGLPLEVRAWMRLGVGLTQLRNDGTTYDGAETGLIGVGFGTRLRPE
jgi:hypothetical protein